MSEARAMKVTGFNHPSIGCNNLEDAARFAGAGLGMQTIPSYAFGFKTARRAA
jgi:catechol 2,3-dioxygenase-like lactoylglutathione lyase family enzyme